MDALGHFIQQTDICKQEIAACVSRLTCAEQIPRTADFKIFLGDDKSVVCGTEKAQFL